MTLVVLPTDVWTALLWLTAAGFALAGMLAGYGLALWQGKGPPVGDGGLRYICPVCGYPGLDEPPDDWSICPQCHTRFDFTNSPARFARLRAAWLAAQEHNP